MPGCRIPTRSAGIARGRIPALMAFEAMFCLATFHCAVFCLAVFHRAMFRLAVFPCSVLPGVSARLISARDCAWRTAWFASGWISDRGRDGMTGAGIPARRSAPRTFDAMFCLASFHCTVFCLTMFCLVMLPCTVLGLPVFRSMSFTGMSGQRMSAARLSDARASGRGVCARLTG